MSIQAAAPLLAFIRKTETGFDDVRAYDTMYGHEKIPVPLTRMTLNAAIDAGPGWTRAHKSSAAGAYQFMHATLKDLRAQGFGGEHRMDPNLQDQMGYALLKRRGFETWLRGELSNAAFGKALAQEWASFPVLLDTKGAHRNVKRGQSYYVGDGLNKALIKPEQVKAILASIRSGAAQPPALPIDLPDDHEPVQEQSAPTKAPVWLIVAAILLATAGIAFAALTGAF